MLGFPVSPTLAPGIGAENGPVSYCAEGTTLDVFAGQCVASAAECIGDVNPDGVVSTPDPLTFLGVFGVNCY